MPEQFDFDRLASALSAAAGIDATRLLGTHPSLFSRAAIPLPLTTLDQMREGIAAIEAVMRTEVYRAAVLSWSPAIARQPVAAQGVFFGYDFHLAVDGPKLIEINTNAGGAMMNAMLLRAWGRDTEAELLEARIVAMFRQEWQLARGDQPLRTLAIVDEASEAQYLTPEFHLFQALFRRHGIECYITDPAAFEVRADRLMLGDVAVDLVYNRLTDFSLDSTVNAAMRAVFEADGVVLTPHPRAHALHADKRNLSLLSDPEFLAGSGVDAATVAVVRSCVPATRLVHPEDGEYFWRERRRWFFKPAAGFGSRAAYRGDKLTRRVFEEILKGGYIAQETVPPSEHPVPVEGTIQMLKADIRCYVYDGETQLVAARLYQGQTTNFRTPGGGFAPVFAVDRVEENA